MRLRRACDTLLVLSAVAALALATGSSPVGAQEVDDSIGAVDISFEVGEFDPGMNDWPIDVVIVAGDLAEGEPFTVELRGEDDKVLFQATQTYSDVPTRIAVDPAVAVGDVADAGISQAQPVVGGVVIERPQIESATSGGGGSGQLALSMVMTVIIVAIVFRSPLPSSSTQRWTK